MLQHAELIAQLHPEKSLGAINARDALDSFQVNTLGHLLTYKHFVPLIPSKRELEKLSWSWQDSGRHQSGSEGSADPAKGLIGDKHSLCMSLSARVGSITDNHRGGWYSYRA
jgi:hypothetical protein